MMITKMKKLRALKKLQYPIDDNVQKFINEVDSEYYSYTMAVKAIKYYQNGNNPIIVTKEVEE